MSPIFFAAQTGHAGVINALLSGGANVNIAGEGGVRSLHIVSREGYTAAVRVLLEAGALVNCSMVGNVTPLYACMLRPWKVT